MCKHNFQAVLVLHSLVSCKRLSVRIINKVHIVSCFGDFLEQRTGPDQFSPVATDLEQIFWCSEALGSTPEHDSGVADFYFEHYETSSETIGRQIAFVVRKPVCK